MKKTTIASVVAMQFAAAAIYSPSLLAQEESTSQLSQPSQSSQQTDSAMDTLVVTGRYTATEQVSSATGMDLSDMETPQSVSVITEQRIKDQGLSNVKGVVNTAVGLSVDPADTERNTFVSRGFVVGSYQVDSVPQSLGDLGGALGETLIDLSIYDRVEIVRGATGLMTGSGNPAAAINFVRKHAESKEFRGYVNVKAGSWDRREVTTDLSGALNDSGSVRGRIVAKYDKHGSFMDRYTKETSVLYGVVDADITDNTLLRVGAGLQNNNADGATWGSLPSHYTDGEKINWSRSMSTATNWSYYDTDAKYYFVNLEHYFANGWRLKTDYSHNEYTNDDKLFYIGGQIDKADGGASLGQWIINGDSKATIDSIGTQLNGDFGLFGRQHDFVAGVLFSHQTRKIYYGYPAESGQTFNQSLLDYQGNVSVSGWPERSLDSDYTTEELGFYAATRFDVTDDLKWIVGSRVSNWNRDGLYSTASATSDVDYGDNGVITPYTGLLYDITAQHRAYVSYAEIFQPQFNKDASGDFIDPLTGTNYEVGLKSSFADDQIHTAISVFRIEQDNLAESTGTLDSKGETIYREVDGVTSNGFEFEANGQVTEGWNLSAGYSQYTAKDKDDQPVSTTRPRKQFKLFTTYNFTSALPELTLGGGVKWQSRIFAEDSSGYRTEQSDYALVDLMGRYDITRQTQVQVNINNVFDKKYYAGICTTCYSYGDPANVTVSLQHNF